jgi:hypothetical protein
MFGIARLNTLAKAATTSSPYWILSYSQTGSAENQAQRMSIDSGGNVLVGYSLTDPTLINTVNDTALVKFNSSGVHQWTRRVNPSGRQGNVIHVMTASTGAHYMFVSGLNSSGVSSAWLYGFDSSGTILTSRSINHTTSASSAAGAMNNNGDTLYAVTSTGTASFTAGTDSAQIKKLTIGGTVSWTRQYSNGTVFENPLAIAANGTNVAVASLNGTANTNIINYSDAGTLSYQRSLVTTRARRLKLLSSGTLITFGHNTAVTTLYLNSIVSAGTSFNWQKSWSGSLPLDMWIDDSETFIYTVSTNAGDIQIQKFNVSDGATQYQRTITFASTVSGSTQISAVAGDSTALYLGCRTALTTGTETKDFIFKLPLDGSLTGTYTVDGTSITYATTTITISNTSLTFNTSTTFTLSTVTSTTTSQTNPTPGTSANTTTTVSI